MTEPVQDLLARIADRAPDPTPDLVRVRRRVARRRAFRRGSGVLAAVAVVAAGTTIVGTLPDRQGDDRLAGPAAQSTSEAFGTDQERTFVLVLGAGPPPASQARLDECLALPGAGEATRRDGGEPTYVVTYTGRSEIAVAEACLVSVPQSYIAETRTTPEVPMPGIPGHPDDVRGVRVCASADAFECHYVRPPDAVELARGFAAARPATRGEPGCRSLSDSYFLLFDHVTVDAEPITMSMECDTVEVAGGTFVLPVGLKARVQGVYGLPQEEVETLVDQCVGSDRSQPLTAYTGLTVAQAADRAKADGLQVQVLGEAGPCFAQQKQRGYLEGRLTIVANGGRVLYAALG